MEREEMIKVLMEKTKAGREEAEKALEESNWDLLDAIIYVERNHKNSNESEHVIIEAEDCSGNGKESGSGEKYAGIGNLIGRIFKFIGKIIKKGNEIFFEIRKDSEKPVRIPLTVAVLLLIVLTIPVLIILTIGLFCGYKYSLAGNNSKYDKVNDIFGKASKSAEDIKNDFKEGYEGVK